MAIYDLDDSGIPGPMEDMSHWEIMFAVRANSAMIQIVQDENERLAHRIAALEASQA